MYIENVFFTWCMRGCCPCGTPNSPNSCAPEIWIIQLINYTPAQSDTYIVYTAEIFLLSTFLSWSVCFINIVVKNVTNGRQSIMAISHINQKMSALLIDYSNFNEISPCRAPTYLWPAIKVPDVRSFEVVLTPSDKRWTSHGQGIADDNSWDKSRLSESELTLRAGRQGQAAMESAVGRTKDHQSASPKRQQR